MVLLRVNTAVQRWRKVGNKDMKYKLSIISIISCLLLACGHQTPQIPSQRKGRACEADSAQLALMQLNRQLAESADNLLAKIVREQNESYALYDGNVWATVIERGDINRPMPKMGEECVVHMKIYNLAGQLLEDTEGTYCVGKLELPTAIDANIREWHHGAKIKMYAPWYAAYGIKGTETIPPYENVMIELELK